MCSARFTADLWDNTATCITRGVKGQRFMSPYRVTGNGAARSLFWTSPDRRACTNGCHDEGRDGEQTGVLVWLDGPHMQHLPIFFLGNCAVKIIRCNKPFLFPCKCDYVL